MPRAPFPIAKALRILERTAASWDVTALDRVADTSRDPYQVLMACLLSLRTKDEVTDPAAERLFTLAHVPAAMARLQPAAVERAIFPVGFYRVKARSVIEISRRIAEDHGGKVPATMEGLLALPGVGRKTANLVLTLGFRKPGICVDTHVHRICNRWGYVHTRTPAETETALRTQLPARFWIPINGWLVAFGRAICQPVSPKCSQCPVERLCPKIGVTHSR